jgi:hypothetical protein
MAHKMTVLLSDPHIDAVYDFIGEDATEPGPAGDKFLAKGVQL